MQNEFRFAESNDIELESAVGIAVASIFMFFYFILCLFSGSVFIVARDDPIRLNRKLKNIHH